MLVDSGLHLKFWPDAVGAAVYVHNRLQSRGSPKTPWELLTGVKPTVEHLRMWGCKVTVHIPKEQQKGHLTPVAKEGILLGFDTHNPKCYAVWVDGGVYHRADVHFMEGGWDMQATRPFTTSSQPVPNQFPTSFQPVPNQFKPQPVPDQEEAAEVEH